MPTYKRANRQYVAMTEAEIWRFLGSQRRIYVGFTMPNGYPHITPIWFCVLDGRIYMRTHDYKVKTALAESGKACCVIDDGDAYRELRGVIVWGASRVVTEPELLKRVEETLNEKYAGQQWKAQDMPEAWVAERRKERRAFIEVTPERFASWDNSKV